MKREERFWFGFLDAGDKSSAVLRDNNLDTHDPETVYLFNLQRKEIVEYKKAIVEARLKPLDDEEVIADMSAAYMVASKEFTPREKPKLVEEKGAVPVVAAKAPTDEPVALGEPIIDGLDEEWEAESS